MSAFAMFSLKDPSLLSFDTRRKDAAECQNLKAVYRIETIPSDTRMREICDTLLTQRIYMLYRDIFWQIQRGKVLEPMVRWYFIKAVIF